MRSRVNKKTKRNFLPSLIRVVFICLVFLVVLFIFRNRDYFTSSLGGKGRIAILFYNSHDSLLAVLDSSGQSLTFIGIPSELYSELPSDYGDYRFGAIYRLGEIDKKGKSLVKAAASNLFAIGIDGVVLLDKEIDSRDVKKSVLTSLPKATSFGFLKFWWYARRLRQGEIKFFDLRSSDSVSELILPDDSHALKFDSYYFDKQIGDLYLRDSMAVSEQLKIEVMNGSESPGLGEKIARYMTNLGVNVLSVSNADKEDTVCRVKFDPKLRKSYALLRIVRDLSCAFEPYASGDIPKADFTLILGGNFLTGSNYTN